MGLSPSGVSDSILQVLHVITAPRAQRVRAQSSADREAHLGTPANLSIQKTRAALSREFRTYRLVLRHDRTPWITRVLLGAALFYVVSPIDLIPDWIPVLGHLDDILIVPALVWLALRFVPAEVVDECRERSRTD